MESEWLCRLQMFGEKDGLLQGLVTAAAADRKSKRVHNR